jgi:hypothetical protein
VAAGLYGELLGAVADGLQDEGRFGGGFGFDYAAGF